MYQRLTIVGNLGRDPEMRYTSDGTPVTNFSVATNRRWTNADGSQGEETVWFRVTVWRRMAEVCNEYLEKGRQVLVEGRLTPDPQTGGPRVWTDRNGNPRASFEVTAQTVKFLGRAVAEPAPGGAEIPEERPMDEEEEIPF
ncbi:MAG: single-stranded DNA-binding protein [Anaerolineae bacterium]